MKLYKEYDNSRAICEDCKAVVETIFLYRDVPFASGNGHVSNILVGVCTQCGSIVSTPAQSTPKIKEARERLAISLETQLPAVYLEALDAACSVIAPERPYASLRKTVLVHYIHDLSSGKRKKEELTKILAARNELFKTDSRAKLKRLSMKVSEEVNGEIETLVIELNFPKTKLIKSIVQLIQDEIVDKESKPKIERLRQIVHIACA